MILTDLTINTINTLDKSLFSHEKYERMRENPQKGSERLAYNDIAKPVDHSLVGFPGSIQCSFG